MINRIINYGLSLLWEKYFFHHGITTPPHVNELAAIQRLNDTGQRPVYIIYRANGGSGFFSNVLHVYRHLQIARQFNFVPVVDFLNYPTIYSKDNLFHVDSWNLYFEPVSPLSLEEAYQAPNLILCSGNFPNNTSKDYDFRNDDSYEFFNNSIKIRSHLDKEINDWAAKLNIISNKTLGVHWRGGELNRVGGHAFGATKEQIFKQVDFLLKTKEYNQIFISTEQAEYFRLMTNRYGSMLVSTDYLRADKNVYKYPSRPEHYYLLGKEILTDAKILSMCHGLIHANSNVSDYAFFMNRGMYKDRIRIDNGINRKSKLALIRYSYAKHLPARWGGLKNNIIYYPNDAN